MICKYFLTIDGSKEEILKNDLKNWDEVEYSLKRSKYSGVVRSFSSSFEFVGNAAQMIRREFMAHQLYSNAEIEVQLMENNWTFTPVFSCPLDFASYEEEEGIVKINAIDNSLAAIIKSRKGNKYEFLMSEFSDSKDTSFRYDGIALDNMVSYKMGGDADSNNIVEFVTLEGQSGTWQYQKFPINHVKDDIVENKEMEWTNQPQEVYQYKTNEELAGTGVMITDRGFPYGSFTNGDYKMLRKSHSESGFDSYVDIRVSAELELSFDDNMDTNSLELWICSATPTGDVVIYENERSREVSMNKLKYDQTKGKYVLENSSYRIYDDYILILISRFKLRGGKTSKIRVISSNITVTWEGHYPPTYLDYVKPKTLLEKLLSSMTDNAVGYTCEIDGLQNNYPSSQFSTLGRWDTEGRLAKTIIIPKDVLNNNPDDIRFLRTSFDEFCKWMEAVFGYVYYIEGNKLLFCHRTKVFEDLMPSKTYERVNDVTYKVNSDAVFSSLEIGYEPGDDDAYNMRYEVNKKADYDTGVLNTEKKMSFISPYFADCIGFELAYEAGINTKSEDKSSQNGVWFVLTKEASENGKSVLLVDSDIQLPQGYEVKDGMFNFYFSPVFCLKANSLFLSSFIKELKLTSANINDLVISVDGGERDLKMKRSFFASSDDCGFYASPIFGVGELTFKTDDQEPPRNLSEPVSLIWKGLEYIGYIKEMDAKYEREASTEYKIIVKKIKRI